VLRRGAAPVDPNSQYVGASNKWKFTLFVFSVIPSWKDTHQVYANAEGVWDAMLNQTNVGRNNNKYVKSILWNQSFKTSFTLVLFPPRFYVIQLLHPIGNTASCILYTRWGRVGQDVLLTVWIVITRFPLIKARMVKIRSRYPNVFLFL